PVEIVTVLEGASASPEPAPPVVLAPGAAAASRADGPLKIPALAAAPSAEEESVALARAHRPIVTLGSLTPPPVAPRARPMAPPATVISAIEETPSRTVRRPSSYAPSEIPVPPAAKEPRDLNKPSRSMWALFAVAGIVFAVGARLSRDREIAQS